MSSIQLASDSESPVLQAKNLKRVFKSPLGKQSLVRAVDGVSLELRKGETVGLLGETGCGKSTLAELMAGLQDPSEGEVVFQGFPLNKKSSKSQWRELRQRVQIMFQNPFDSVDPRYRVMDILTEPLEVNGVRAPERRDRAIAALETMKLTPPAEFIDRYPHEMSGGQLQRVCIARALMLNPSVLIADEPVSMLDISVRAGILILLDELKNTRNMGILHISHDISTLVAVSDRLLVMYLGKIVESGSTEVLVSSPAHPYLRVLLNSVPTVHDTLFTKGERELTLKGDIPDPSNIPDGCSLWPRCPLAVEKCKIETPKLKPLDQMKTHRVACHMAHTDDH